jgi:hypothetical protein
VISPTRFQTLLDGSPPATPSRIEALGTAQRTLTFAYSAANRQTIFQYSSITGRRRIVRYRSKHNQIRAAAD